MISRTKPDFTAPTGGKAPVGGIAEGLVLDLAGTGYPADATILTSGISAEDYLENQPTAVLRDQQEGYGVCGAVVTNGDWLSAAGDGTGRLVTSAPILANVVVAIAKSTTLAADEQVLIRVVSPFVLP